MRKFAFRLTERSSKESLTFAAEDFDTYESWLRVLFGNIEYDESDQQTEEKSVGTSTYSEDFKQAAGDHIADYFFAHDTLQVQGSC